MKKIILNNKQFNSLVKEGTDNLVGEIKQIEKNNNVVLFSDGKYTLKAKRIRDLAYPEEADEAWLEWVGEEWNPRTAVGGILFILFHDFYNYTDKAKKTVSGLFANHYRYAELSKKEKGELNEALDKKWGMPLKKELLSWVDDYINEYWYEFPEFIKEESMREWDFSLEEAEDAFKEYQNFSFEKMLEQINWNKEERLSFAKWLYKRHSRFDNDDSEDEDSDYEMREIEGLGDTMEYIRDVNNEWLIHFSNSSEDAYNIRKTGFHHSAYDLNDLRATTDLITKFDKEGYNFAYLALDGNTYYKSFWSYGSKISSDKFAILFKANGVLIKHKGDLEQQVIFPSNTAKDIILLEQDHGRWFVKSIITKKILHQEPLSQEMKDKYEVNWYDDNGRKAMERRGLNTSNKKTEYTTWAFQNLENLVKWVTNNFKQYHRHLTMSKINENCLESVGYHAGDLGKARDTYYHNMTPSRSTGYFGTGTYFFGNKERAERFADNERPIHEIEFDNYNLFRPSDDEQATTLHRLLNSLNDYMKYPSTYPQNQKELDYIVSFAHMCKNEYHFSMIPDHEFDIIMFYLEGILSEYEMDKLKKRAETYGAGDESYRREYFADYCEEIGDYEVGMYRKLSSEVSQHEALPLKLANYFNLPIDEINRILNKVKRIVDNYDKYATNLDSVPTLFMKELGYEGVDVRGFKYNDIYERGSVIYDLK